MRFDPVGELRIARRAGAPSVLPARATPVPAARNQTLNSSLHAIREPARPGPLVFHRGANRLQPSSKSRASSLYALVNVSTCAFKMPCLFAHVLAPLDVPLLIGRVLIGQVLHLLAQVCHLLP